MKRMIAIGYVLGLLLGTLVTRACAEPLQIESSTEGQYIRCGNFKFNKENGVYKISDCKALTDLVMGTVATPAPTPTLAPAPPIVTAKPTSKPETTSIPCEDLGGLKNFQMGETKHFCFDVDGSIAATYPFFEIQVVNKANWNCSTLAASLFNPQGEMLYYSYGTEPNTVGARGTGGRFEEWVKLYTAADGCFTYTFTQNP